MATITRFPFVSYLRSDTTMHVQHVRGGQVRHAATAAGFWFNPRTAVLAEVPMGDRQEAVVFRARTADFQEVAVTATVSYRVTDPARCAGRFEFDIDPVAGSWTSTPLEQVGALLTEVVQQSALARLATMPVRAALAEGVVAVREAVEATLLADPRLGDRGLAVTDVQVASVRADADLERALRTQAREEVQQEADRATFERRALAVERERAIAENEMQNQIELARREEQLVAQRGQNRRAEAEEEAAADEIGARSRASSMRLAAQARAEEIRGIGEAEAAAQRANLTALAEVDHELLLAMALRELAQHVPDIGSLTITPDVVTQVFARLGGSAGEG